MRNLIVVLVVIISLLVTPAATLADDPAPAMIELAYDDGTSESGTSHWGAPEGSAIAVHFTSPGSPFTIRRVKLFVPNIGVATTEFEIKFYALSETGEGPGEPISLAEPLYASAAAGNTWVDVTLPAPLELTSPDFFVAMVWLTAPGNRGVNAQFLGMDNTAPQQRTWWTADQAAWSRIQNLGTGDRNGMIRAVIETIVPEGTLAATLAPEPEPAVPPQVLFFDDFSSGQTKLRQNDEGWDRRIIKDGTYYIIEKKAAGTGTSGIPVGNLEGDFSIEFDAAFKSGVGKVGSTFRHQNIGNHYAFYLFTGNGWALGKMEQNSWTSLAMKFNDSAIKTGGVFNKVKIAVRKNNIDIYINDTLVESKEDNTYRKGFVTLAFEVGVSGYELEAAFDNVKVTRP
jgi:hypothetical protein